MYVIKIQLSNIIVMKSKDHSYFGEFALWILIKHMNIHSRVCVSSVLVIKIQLSDISVNKSKHHSYFEGFTLWILIKHMNIHSRVKPMSPLCR